MGHGNDPLRIPHGWVTWKGQLSAPQRRISESLDIRNSLEIMTAHGIVSNRSFGECDMLKALSQVTRRDSRVQSATSGGELCINVRPRGRVLRILINRRRGARE